MIYIKIQYIVIIIVIFINSCGSNNASDQTIKISGAFALYPMMIKWSEEYKKINPNIIFDITAGGAGKGMTDALAGMVDIGMVSREINRDEIEKGAWHIPVAIDAVVPVFNTENPLYDKIIKRGLTRRELSRIWDGSADKSWRTIVPSISEDVMFNAYTRSDACGAAQTWALFFGKKQENLKGTGVYGDPGIAEAVRKDKFGIGYNNINFVYDRDTKKTVKSLSVLPIDINENGRIDPDEKIYETRDLLIAAIAGEKYPTPPSRKLYLVIKKNSTNPELRKFIKWILTDGQRYINESGYINLQKAEISSGIERLNR